MTYILKPGSVAARAAGWRTVHKTKGGSWNTPARPRVDTAAHLVGQKQLWEAA